MDRLSLGRSHSFSGQIFSNNPAQLGRWLGMMVVAATLMDCFNCETEAELLTYIQLKVTPPPQRHRFGRLATLERRRRLETTHINHYEYTT